MFQLTDRYGFNFANVGSHLLEGPVEEIRSGYTFMPVAPDWQGHPIRLDSFGRQEGHFWMPIDKPSLSISAL